MILLSKEEIQKRRDINNFLDKWKEVMYHTKLYNSGNQSFNLFNLKKEDYGYSATILPPYGYSFEHLENIRNIIQDNLGCMFINKINESRKSSNVRFVTEKFDSGIYKPIEIKPWQLYLAKSMDKTDFIVDMYKTPHVLLSGSNNSGKSRMLDCIITTLVSNFDNQQIMLFLIQLAKDDLIIYEDCKQTYAFADNLSNAYEVLNYIDSVVLPNRSALVKPIRKSGKGNSIIDYNKLHPENHQPIIYVIFDEMSTIMESQGDDKDTRKIKQYLVSCAEHIAQYGRALCVYGIFCLQRSVATMLSPFIKSQSNVRVSFRQNNKKSSEVAMDNGDIAYQLPLRIAVVEIDGYEYLKVPEISDKTIFQYITPSLQPNHRTLFRDLKKMAEDNKEKDVDDHMKTNSKEENQINNSSNSTQDKEIPKGKGEAPIPPSSKNHKTNKNKDKIIENVDFSFNNFEEVDPNTIYKKEEKMNKNIKNIPNFVPFSQRNIEKNLIIIDQTKVGLVKSQKPIKKEKK